MFTDTSRAVLNKARNQWFGIKLLRGKMADNCSIFGQAGQLQIMSEHHCCFNDIPLKFELLLTWQAFHQPTIDELKLNMGNNCLWSRKTMMISLIIWYLFYLSVQTFLGFMRYMEMGHQTPVSATKVIWFFSWEENHGHHRNPKSKTFASCLWG